VRRFITLIVIVVGVAVFATLLVMLKQQERREASRMQQVHTSAPSSPVDVATTEEDAGLVAQREVECVDRVLAGATSADEDPQEVLAECQKRTEEALKGSPSR